MGLRANIFDPCLVIFWHLESGLENFLKKANFLFCQVKKISLVRTKKYVDNTWVSSVFIAGQEYAWVELGPISRFCVVCCSISDMVMVIYLLNWG